MSLNKFGLILYITILCMSSFVVAEESHDEASHQTHQGEEDVHEEDGEHEDEEGRVHLNQEQQDSAGIVVEVLRLQAIPVEIEALGEIRLNAYATSQITPRIDAQVVKRLVQLGDEVSSGQALVILSSVAMAQAQGELLVTANEWQRVKKLGKKVVSKSRYLESRITFQQAKAKVRAYGMTVEQTKKLLKENTISQADGDFTLLSTQHGTVIRDDFITGQLVEPGQMLFEVTNEAVLWVEARVNPRSINEFSKGADARIKVGDKWLNGKVIQVHHALDETTRTLAVRLQVPNPDDDLHPGQFITARIKAGDSDVKVLSLPTNAVLRSPDGDWQVFIEEEPGEFEAKEIEVVREIPGVMVIEGLAVGTRVVTEGAFFVQSEQAKSSFEVHNH